jgi:peptidoglycan/LPS O-acetylase OafA/YrhL
LDKTKARLHGLDALRGLAAISVVLWHWQHFQLLGTTKLTWTMAAPPLTHTQQPFFAILRLFYTYGYVGVDFFFLISGFIFFRLYAEKVADRSLSLGAFWLRRFSRLYPLHLATLIIVVVLQLLFRQTTGQYFIYGANGFGSFVKSLLLFQVNGDGAAFNGPTWSVTIEIIMYGIFFVLAWLGLLRSMLVPLIMFGIGLSLYPGHQNIAVGLCGFFEGGVVYLVFQRIRVFLRSRHGAFRRSIISLTAIGCLCGWAAVLVANYAPASPWGDAWTVATNAQTALPRLCVAHLLFPMTVLFVCLHEEVTGADYRYVSWLGEISYSSYLLHFPLQLLFALAIARGLLPIAVRDSDMFSLIYFGLLIVLSLVVFRKFELPMQRLLRRGWVDWAGVPKMWFDNKYNAARLRATSSPPI